MIVPAARLEKRPWKAEFLSWHSSANLRARTHSEFGRCGCDSAHACPDEMEGQGGGSSGETVQARLSRTDDHRGAGL